MYRRELAWREFYAAVLFEWPESARDYYQPQLRAMTYAPTPSDAFTPGAPAGPATRSSTPACARCSAQGWMHNRVRMIVASFLVKDLHIEWQHGARVFMHHLVDGDLASNQHGWQWTAGTGTDPAPYFRIFNPITQGEKFDPDGDYVRRWVPELRASRARRCTSRGCSATTCRTATRSGSSTTRPSARSSRLAALPSAHPQLGRRRAVSLTAA